jgi:hypothetical protein
MEHVGSNPSTMTKLTDYQQAWEMVTSQLRMEMTSGLFDTWVKPVQPLGYSNQVFTIGVHNTYSQEWVEERLSPRISRMLAGLYQEPVVLKVKVTNGFYREGATFPPDDPIEQPAASKKRPAVQPVEKDDLDLEEDDAQTTGKGAAKNKRKLMLQRVYGSERAGIIQPDRGMFVTMYFFNNWLPLIGHSAFTVILAARSMCYWNPMNGELRNTIETEMAQLAARASVSVRTVKDVLNSDLVQKYFIRYKVRRVMTPNGVRTAGISLQVRMDDPLTPDDQSIAGVDEDEWYLPEFGDEEE